MTFKEAVKYLLEHFESIEIDSFAEEVTVYSESSEPFGRSEFYRESKTAEAFDIIEGELFDSQ